MMIMVLMMMVMVKDDDDDVNPNLPGLFCELKFLGGGGAIMAPP